MRPICRECWDPVDSDGDVCSWCAMTPMQRRARLRRDGLLLLLGVLAAAAVILLSACGGGEPEPPTEQLTMCAQPLDQPTVPCDWNRE